MSYDREMLSVARVAFVRNAMALSAAMACGCTESPVFGGSTDESSASSSSSTTVATDDAPCACIDPSISVGKPTAPDCGPRLCEVHAHCPLAGQACLDKPDATHDEASLTCALGALAARTPGYIEWSLTYSDEENAYETGYVVLLDDGRAITQSYAVFDLAKEYRGATLGAMPEQQYFDACAASTSLAERFECLAFVPDEPQVVCDPPW